jgi:DNA-binding LacI/PurR family transcriptional regulator
MPRPGIPVFQRVAEHIRNQIIEKNCASGEIIAGQRAIAAALGVSRPSVKRAIQLLQQEGVLDCVPSVGAKVKRSPKQATLVGYLVHDLQDPFHVEMVREMGALLEKRDAGLIVSEGRSSEHLIKMGATRIVKAGQLVGAADEDRLLTVYIGLGPARSKIVAADNESGMRQICAHLGGLGHRLIAYAGPAPQGDDMRFSLLASAAGDFGLTVSGSFVLPKLEEKQCRKVLQAVVAAGAGGPTALVCYNDWLATKFLPLAAEMGLRVPEDLSVTGFDDLFTSSLLSVPLTTVRIPRDIVARKVLELLFDADPARPQCAIVDVSLVARSSTGRAKVDGQ